MSKNKKTLENYATFIGDKKYVVEAESVEDALKQFEAIEKKLPEEALAESDENINNQ